MSGGWERWIGCRVRVTWLWGSWPARFYRRGHDGYHHISIPPGLWVRWGPPSQFEYHRRQKRRNR